MANVVTIQFKGLDPFQEAIKDYPIIDDSLILDYESTFSSFKDLMPSSMGSFMDILKYAQQASTATTMKTGAIFDLTSKLNVPMWTGTSPLKLTFRAGFFADETGGNVMNEVERLVSFSLLTEIKPGDPKTKYMVPGPSLFWAMKGPSADVTKIRTEGLSKIPKHIEKKGISAVKQYKQRQNTKYNALIKHHQKQKIIAFEIPGVCRVSNAFISRALPTISKHECAMGPMWATVDVTMQSLFPANSSMFKKDPFKDFRTEIRLRKEEIESDIVD